MTDRAPTAIRRLGIGRALGALVGLAFLATVLALAGPARVWALLTGIDLLQLAGAAVLYLAVASLRALRLALLLERGRLPITTAVPVSMAAQGAALLLPARLGELALPALLQRLAGVDLAAGLVILVASRLLDVAALGVWSGLAAAALWGVTRPLTLLVVTALVLSPAALPLGLATADRCATRLLGPRGHRGRRWARRIRRMSRAATAVRRRPARLAGAAAASLVLWGGIWLVTWRLLIAMGHPWSLRTVLTGSVPASLTNLLPISAIGNLGPLEAGWTAAFTALGIPVETAAATGLASHLWTLLFVGVTAALSWWALGAPVLAGTRPGR